MAISKEKKSQINRAIYSEVVNKLELYFKDLSIEYMPINGTYFYYINKFRNSSIPRLFSNIEIVIERQNYAKAINFLDRLTVTKKVADIKSKSAYSYTLDGINVIRVDVYNSIHFPGNCIVNSEELFSRAARKNALNVNLPSHEDVLLLLIGKAFNFIDQFFDYSIFSVIKPVVSSEQFSWDRFWGIVQESKITRFTTFFLSLNNMYSSEKLPVKSNHLYSRLMSCCITQLIYNACPRILKKILYKALLSDTPINYLYKQSLNNLIRLGKKTWSNIYGAVVGKIARKYVIESENTVFNTIITSVNRALSEYQLDYTLKEDFIIGTSSGLWYLKDNKLYQLTFASSYGITFDGDKWYANQNLGQFSRIIFFKIGLDSDRVEIINPSYFSIGLPNRIHQIDFYDNVLYAVDTLNNRIITMNRYGKKKYYFPNRSLKNAENNNHFNSIFITDKNIYVCAHNGTLKPKKYSEIYVLNKNRMKKEKIIQTSAGNAHNILLKEGKIIYCDSTAGQLICEKDIVFQDSKYFIRGLSLTDNYILAGGSGFARREDRALTDGILFVLDTNFNYMKKIELKNIGQVYEIRGVSGDYGLSALNRKTLLAN